MSKSSYGIGIIGFGTVGAGVVAIVQEQADLLAKRLGFGLHIAAIADLDITSDRGVSVDPALLTTDASALIANPDVDVVVELVGGTTLAAQFIEQAMQAGKPVVTANKALLAEKGPHFYALAEAQKVGFAFEASVAGGIPVLKALREGLIANEIQAVYGIMNGTCNYILDRMEREGLPFDQVLVEAQEAGFAEAEPSLDVDGWDTAHKTCVLAALGFDSPIPLDALSVTGIRGVAGEDLHHARELGYGVKLLAIIKRQGAQLLAQVRPTLIPSDHLLGGVHGVFNAVFIQGDQVGDTMFYGRGAGREPTASAVVADLCDVCRDLHHDRPGVPPMPPLDQPMTLADAEAVEERYYLRTVVADEPGVMAQITQCLGNHGVSIASVIQREQAEGAETAVVLITRPTSSVEFVQACAELEDLSIVTGPVVYLPIEDLH